MGDVFLLKATHDGKPAWLGNGILAHLFSVEAEGKDKTVIKLSNPASISLEEYIVDDSFDNVSSKLEYGMD